MSITELLPHLKALPRVDKLRLIQFLASELAREEGLPLLESDGAFPLWTPYGAFDAAATLLHALEEEGSLTLAA
jgi:hypothetical protein